jgi:hypothetical protein
VEEFPELLHILTAEFARWKAGNSSTTKPALRHSPKAQFSEFISSLISEKSALQALHPKGLSNAEARAKNCES